MKPVTLRLTIGEVKLLATLASDQLFRKEFIDPKMPGYASDVEELKRGKALVGRLRLMVERVPCETMLLRVASPRAARSQTRAPR